MIGYSEILLLGFFLFIIVIYISFLLQEKSRFQGFWNRPIKLKPKSKIPSANSKAGTQNSLRQTKPGNSFLHLRKAQIARKNGDLEEAIVLYKKSLEFYPNHSNSFFFLAKCLEDKKLFLRAKDNYLKALKNDYNSNDCNIALTRCYLELSNLSKAIEYANCIDYEETRDSTLFYSLGLKLYQEKKLSEAARFFEKAIYLGCKKSLVYWEKCTSPERKSITKIKKPLQEQKTQPKIEKKKNSIAFVNYSSTYDERISHYPIFKMPNYKTVIRSFKFGKTNRRGITEEAFQNKLEKRFSEFFNIYGNIRLNIDKCDNPYEPDIAMISKSDLNIRIDVEIDEPYSGIDREPIHFKGIDDQRDQFFIKRGWIIIRFSEYQIHKFPEECLDFISKIFNGLHTIKSFTKRHLIVEKFFEEKVWSYQQCVEWEEENYRETYLNHQFQLQPDDQHEINPELSSDEKEEERFVENYSFSKKVKESEKSIKRVVNKEKSIRKFNDPEDKRRVISEAINSKKDIQFKYQKSINFSNGKRSIRTINPTEFTFYSSLCVKGYCYERKDDRVFNLERISDLIIDPEEIIYWEENNYDNDQNFLI